MDLNAIDERLLSTIAGLHGVPQGAYNIRKDGELLSRMSTENIEITTKSDKPGIDVRIKPGTRNESLHIPVIISASGLVDLVYNTFEVGEGSDVLIVAGCGIHNPASALSQHDGIHEFIVRRKARVRYVEKHYGEGTGTGGKVLNPTTLITLEEGAEAEFELVQIAGVDSTRRVTEARLHAGSSLVINERLLTEGAQAADSLIKVELLEAGAGVDVLARSVARGSSKQTFRASLIARAASRGHVACDSIITDSAEISSMPELRALDSEAELTHEAAIGRIAGEQVTKLMSLGLTEEEAIKTILAGFLR